MIRFDIVSIFPGFFAGPLDYGIVRRARESSLIEAHVHDLRDFTHDRHKTVDDRPFGGGEGMVMKPGPLFEAVESLLGGPIDVREHPMPVRTAIVLLSAAGKLFRQEMAERFAQVDRIVLICGRYEGVDERVAEHLATDEISVGDFVLSGGELAAAMVMDATVRLIPGALGNEDSAVNESFGRLSEPVDVSLGDERLDKAAVSSRSFTLGSRSASEGPLVHPESAASGRRVTRPCLLDFPHYTRPASFRGWDVPEMLLSGNHEQIRQWRRQKALEKTLRNRPDLLAGIEGNY